VHIEQYQLMPTIQRVNFYLVSYMMLQSYPELWTIRIIGHWNVDFNVVCCTSPLELCFNFDDILDPATTMALDGGFNPNEWLDGRGEAVGHEFELSVRWDEGNGAVVFEPGEADTLMEFDIFHFNGFSSRSYG
jgi:hypothetical protein